MKPASKGVVIDNSWLPDAAFAKAWASYNTSGKPSDTTPPPAPTNVRFDNNELTWNAQADLESGLSGFIIERDGKELARLPEKPVGKLGTPLFQGLGGGDTPIVALPVMRFKTHGDGKSNYAVRSINAVGLTSKPSIPPTP